MKKVFVTSLVVFCFCSCSGSGDQFSGWQQTVFGETAVTSSVTKTFAIANESMDAEQHVRAIAFDTGSNAAGHFRIDKLTVGERTVEPTDIVIPPGGKLQVTVTYAPMNLEPSQATYGGWVTGESKRWEPVSPEEAKRKANEEEIIYHRAIVEAVYDYPREGIFFVELVGEAVPGPYGEEEAGGAFAACEPGNGIACYTGSFALDIPQLVPGGPKMLEMTGPIRFALSGGSATLRMDDFPFVLFVLRSEDIPQLPSGVTATLVLSGSEGVEAAGTFDGSRLSFKGVGFRIRVALGELTVDKVRQGLSALVDFDVSDLEITTIKPYDNGDITLHLETTLTENPSGNDLFDQFLSGAKIVGVLEGDLAF